MTLLYAGSFWTYESEANAALKEVLRLSEGPKPPLAEFDLDGSKTVIMAPVGRMQDQSKDFLKQVHHSRSFAAFRSRCIRQRIWRSLPSQPLTESFVAGKLLLNTFECRSEVKTSRSYLISTSVRKV